MAAALDEFRIEGIHHNIAFLNAIMHAERFRAGRLTTGYIAEEYPDGFHGRPGDQALSKSFVAAAVAAKLKRTDRAGRISGSLNGACQPTREYAVTLGDRSFAVTEAQFVEGRLFLRIDGEPFSATTDWAPGQPLVRFREGNSVKVIQIARVAGSYRLAQGGSQAVGTGRRPDAAKLAELMPKKAPPDTSKLLLCPMPGLVVSVNVAQGQEVKAGEPLAVVEAMKMENVLLAERDGTIKQINVKKGDSLALDDVILEFV